MCTICFLIFLLTFELVLKVVTGFAFIEECYHVNYNDHWKFAGGNTDQMVFQMGLHPRIHAPHQHPVVQVSFLFSQKLIMCVSLYCYTVPKGSHVGTVLSISLFVRMENGIG